MFKRIHLFFVTHQRYVIPVMLFGLALLPRLVSLSHFISVDEPVWINRSARFLQALISGNFAQTLQSSHPGVTTMWSGAAGLLWRYLFGGQAAGADLTAFLKLYEQPISDSTILMPLRAGTVLITSLSVPALYLILRDWLGSGTALFGVVLFALDPFFIAHSRVIHQDALASAFVTVALALALVSFWHRHSYWKIALSGAMAALACLTKLTTVSLVLLCGLFVVAAWFWSPQFQLLSRRRRLALFLKCAGVWGVVALVVFVAVLPSMWVNPAGSVLFMLQQSAETAESGHNQFLWGVVSNDPGWLFYPVVFGFRTTPVTLLGLLCLAGVLIGTRFRTDQRHFSRLGLALGLAFVVFVSLSPKKQDRYLLPIFPWLDFLAAAGWLALWQFLKGVKVRGLSGGRYVWLAVLVAAQLGCALYDAPYFFGYYNPLLGGPATASKALLVGWGDGLDEVGRYLNQKPDARDLIVSVVPAIGVRPYFVGHVFDFYSDYSAYWSDYVVLYVSHMQRSLPSPELLQCFKRLELEQTISRDGLPYAYIYKGFRLAPFDVQPAEHQADLRYRDLFQFLGFDELPDAAHTDNLRIRLYWKSLAKTNEDFTWSLRLVDDEGHLWAQQDAQPLGGVLPTSWWRPGAMVVSEGHVLDLPAGIPPGRYKLQLQVYLPTSMTILPFRDTIAGASGMTADVGSVTIPKQPVWRTTEQLPVQQAVSQEVVPSIRLVGYTVTTPNLSPGQELGVILYWQALTDVHETYKVGLSLLDPFQRAVLQNVDHPHAGKYPTNVWTAGELVQDRHFLSIPGDISAGTYDLQVGLWDDEASHVISAPIGLGAVTVAGRPRSFKAPPDIQYAQGADFDGKIRLLGSALAETTVRLGDHLRLTLYWQALDTPPNSYKTFVHVLGSGAMWGQDDSVPGQGSLPTNTWLPGEVISDVHEVSLKSDVPAGDYTLEVGFYDPDNGQRLGVTGSTQPAQENAVVLRELVRVQK